MAKKPCPVSGHDTHPTAMICPHCRTTIDHALTNIAEYWRALRDLRTRTTRYGETGTTPNTTGTAPLPVDHRFTARTAQGTEAYVDALRTLGYWTRLVATAQKPRTTGPTCPPTRNKNHEPIDCWHKSCRTIRREQPPRNQTIEALCEYLARHTEWLRHHEAAVDAYNDITHTERTLAKLVDRPPERWYAGRCMATLYPNPENPDDTDGAYHCQAELYATTEDGSITCPHCHTEWDMATRRKYLLAVAQDEAATGPDLARAIVKLGDYDLTGPNPTQRLEARIRKWASRNQLTAVRHIGRQPLYRVRDVIDLLVEAMQRDHHRERKTA